jgi:hypothetical protein
MDVWLLCESFGMSHMNCKCQAKELVSATKKEKDYITDIMRSMVYAKSRRVYESLKLFLAKELSKTMDPDDDHSHVVAEEEDLFEDDQSDDSEDDEDVVFYDDDTVSEVSLMAVREARDDEDVRRGRSHRFYRYFTKNWLQCEVLMFKRGNVAHLGNNTNNRIEAKFGASKRVLNAIMDLEETIRAIRELQAVSEDEYVDELTKIGSRNSRTGDAELDQLINTVSDHAYDLIEVNPLFTLVKVLLTLTV